MLLGKYVNPFRLNDSRFEHYLNTPLSNHIPFTFLGRFTFFRDEQPSNAAALTLISFGIVISGMFVHELNALFPIYLTCFPKTR